MYIVSQITPLEWRKSSVHTHDTHHDAHNDKENVCGDNEMCNVSCESDEDEESCCSHAHGDEIMKPGFDHHDGCIADYENLLSMASEFYSYETKCQCSTSSPTQLDSDDIDIIQKIELISYENNFNLINSFWWSMATLIQQTTSDLYPKVTNLSTI